MRRTLTLLAVMLLALGTLAGSALAKPAEIGGTVTAVDLAFVPDEVTIPQGTNLLFSNDDDEFHTVSGTQFGTLQSGVVPPGRERIVRTARLQSGSYDFFCAVHPFMEGTLIVE